jgi:peptidoglycan hydrolase-like protein with peptidoglycan-binding domain/GH25 family lysozyme M1 (1,4-beta-N-acetylmuramidase)
MSRYKPKHAALKAKRHGSRRALAGVALGVAATLGAGGLAQADEIGHDISRWQGNINVNALGSAVIVKAGGSDIGYYYTDTRYKQKAQEVRNSGRKLGHYYYNGWADPVSAANSFVDNLTAYRAGDPLVYDAEESRFVSPAKVLAWVQQVRARLGNDANVYVYMSSSVTRAYNWSSVAASGVKLWVANYGPNNGRQNGSGPSVGYWDRWLIWQYTSVGRVSGYSGNLDTNLVRTGAWGNGQATTVVTLPASSSSVPYGTYLGYNIAQTQRMLNANGASLAVDGLYGPATRAAVRAFQAAHGLTVDGLAGPLTQMALRGSSASAGSLLSVDGVVGPATISRAQRLAGTTVDGVISWQSRLAHRHAWRVTSYTMGTYGSQLVRAMQRRLGVTVDGHLGPATIRAMQRHLGVTVDGSLGPVTARAWQARLNTGSLI